VEPLRRALDARRGRCAATAQTPLSDDDTIDMIRRRKD